MVATPAPSWLAWLVLRTAPLPRVAGAGLGNAYN
ncbi:MAG: hypothetical protein ACJAW7_001107 [Candidatus Azotimanducaceae bacterium]|jgi:hypothetical protein